MQTYWLEEAMADGGDVVTQGIGGGMPVAVTKRQTN
jgi:hypothetical protein